MNSVDLLLTIVLFLLINLHLQDIYISMVLYEFFKTNENYLSLINDLFKSN